MPSSDDGTAFIRVERRNLIEKLMSKAGWQILHRGLLTTLLHAPDWKAEYGTILISCHIDSLYSEYGFSDFGDGELLGTFDNSICNAALIDLIQRGGLPSQCLVAFTGDEEHGSRGARETVLWLQENCEGAWSSLEMIVVLDVTDEAYGKSSFTIENLFVEQDWPPGQRLRFADAQDFELYLRGAFKAGAEIKFVHEDESAPDESWEYEEHDLNVITFCLPCARNPKVTHSDWMHDDAGFLVTKKAIPDYSKALTLLCHRILETIRR